MKNLRLYTLAQFVLMLLVPGTLAASSEKIIFALPPNGSGGTTPTGGLISDAAGNLYGTTAAGGTSGHGAVFKLSLANGTWKEDLLYSFKGGAIDGSDPESALLLDAAGNLYGTTAGGGASNNGTVFRLATDGAGGWAETVLHTFNGTDGGLPILAPLVADAGGNLYGVTQGYCYRGTCANGTVFELSLRPNGSWGMKVLHSFGHIGLPSAGVIFDKAGNLYGTTSNGGPQNCAAGLAGCGTIYKLARGATSWTFTNIHTFSYADGAYPMGNLIMDGAGNLFGTTGGGGGTNNGGVAFRLSPTKTGWKETLLHAFGAAGDGQEPSSLVLDASGNLYGSVPLSTDTNFNLQNGYVFKLSHQASGTWSESVLYRFPQVNFAPFPNSNLIWNKARTALMGTIGPYSDPAGAVYKVIP
jgi:uncharacterized repeat protein (TIGR03803 family)